MVDIPTYADVLAARERIAGYVHRTPIHSSSTMNAVTQAEVFLKCENLQRVGAFKARGACNAVFALDDEQIKKGVATHSSGNHGAAVALAAMIRKAPAHVVMPSNSSDVKRAAVRHYQAKVWDCAPGMRNREETLARVMEETGAHMVHPYDDSLVIAGQGTAALELMDDVGGLDVILVPVGGGGLIGGTLLAAEGFGKGTRVIGVEPRQADDARQSFRRGARVIMDSPDTIADGLRASLGERNFELIHRYADDIICVEESEIIAAMRFVWERMKLVIEPSSAVPIAALLHRRLELPGKRIGLIISGGNVDLDHLPW
jgi:threonine dehydratase